MGDARREADELQPVAVQVDGDRGNRRTTLESQIDRRRGSRAADDIAILVRDRDREAQYLVVGNDLLRHAEVLDARLVLVGIVETDDHMIEVQRGIDIHMRDIARVRSEEHTSELQSLMRILYAVFSLNHKNLLLLGQID